MCVSKITVDKEYKEIRNSIYKYLLIVYNTEKISDKNKNENFSVDECLFGHVYKNKYGYWV